MISYQVNGAVIKTQTFVLVDGQLYKAGAQRMFDSVSGHRAEPTLKCKAIKVWTAHVKDEGFAFGRASTAVFDEEGQARVDVAIQALHSFIAGLDETIYVKERLEQDAQVQRFIEVASQPVDLVQLAEMARTAKTLPTR